MILITILDFIITNQSNRLIYLAGREPVDDTPKGRCHHLIEFLIAKEGEKITSLIGPPRQILNKAIYDVISEYILSHKWKKLFRKISSYD